MTARVVFYRLMNILAIVLPLSFVAHSVIANAGAENIDTAATPTKIFQSASPNDRQLLESQTFAPTPLVSADSLSSGIC